MLATLCHDLGKPRHHEVRGRPRALARPRGGRGARRPSRLLDRWNVHTLLGYDVRAQVLALVANHLKPGQLYDDRERVSDGAIRRLARKCEPDLLYRVARADCLGRTGDFPPVAMEWFLRQGARARRRASARRSRSCGAATCWRWAWRPGPEVGRIVKAVYERQLDGAVTTLEEARTAAAALLRATPASEDAR